ncbi:MAG TPA: TRAM domain-containing protein [Dermatophilaceae bacterium]|nr:TRAM domain-containing protein [Dermatophilaceae bacterium]
MRGESLVGTEVEVEVGPVAHGGHCVARHEGRVLFVRHTLPGERVVARVTEGGTEDRFLRADAVRVLTASPDRIEPVCRVAGPGGCGGCDWQHAELTAQRRLKAAVVREQLTRLAGVDVDVEVLPVPGDVAGLRWRTRVELAVGPTGRAGLHPHRSRAVLPIDDCPIASADIVDSGVLQRDWRGARAVELIVPSVGEPVVVPVGEPAAPMTTVRERVGATAWQGELEVAARGFWQVHPGAAATYVDRVLAELAPRPGEHAVDLYAGAGLFALALADAVGPTGSVVAIEGDRAACADAVANAADRPWVSVRAGGVQELVAELTTADLVVLDPPRSGAGRTVVEAICALQPRRVAYVACDPAALARDLAYAAAAGYRLAGLAAYDAFPMTHHVECIATLEVSAPRR